MTLTDDSTLGIPNHIKSVHLLDSTVSAKHKYYIYNKFMLEERLPTIYMISSQTAWYKLLPPITGLVNSQKNYYVT